MKRELRSPCSQCGGPVRTRTIKQVRARGNPRIGFGNPCARLLQVRRGLLRPWRCPGARRSCERPLCPREAEPAVEGQGGSGNLLNGTTRAVAAAESMAHLRQATKEDIVTTRHGKAAGVLIGFESEDDWFDYRLENDPRFLDRIAAARANLRDGRGLRIEDVEGKVTVSQGAPRRRGQGRGGSRREPSRPGRRR
jgi:hypothetical protein